MPSYISLTIYRNRRGLVTAYTETSAGRSTPTPLSTREESAARELLGALAGAEGRRWLDAEPVMSCEELARESAALVARLKGGGQRST